VLGSRNSGRSPTVWIRAVGPVFMSSPRQILCMSAQSVDGAWRSGGSGYINWPASGVSRAGTLPCILDTSRIPVLTIEAGSRDRTSSQ
jgi:hypothetical protein